MAAQKKKTVAFYEIVRAKEAGGFRLEKTIDWGQALTNLSRQPIETLRIEYDGDAYVGNPIQVDGVRHLVLARVRAGDIHQVDWVTQRIDPLQLDGDRDVVDTTIACFLPYGNIVGLMQGSASAPRATTLQRWLNAVNSGLREHVAVIPLVGRDAWGKLERAEAVNLFEMRVRPAQGPSIFSGDVQGLADAARHSHKVNPDALVTLTFKIPKGRGLSRSAARARGERRLHGDVHGFLAEYGSHVGPYGAVDRAIAEVMLTAPDGSIVEDRINFVTDHIAVQSHVSLPRGTDMDPWYEAAVNAVLQVAAEKERDLKGAVSAMP
ncbi:hypothetical protein [Streptomyces rhizosphaericus]|uniref:Uncharacterized protein n=1 Tax=Streptomyces rhizosphaericus TaxID=114699 RepID=A0A6G4ARG6_9ACTN|nr:hypothetical protein [Streptomyces rhizosphaericus]NEW75057.1 hypothetical protein [Streptomyces rhizosphaericus]